MIDGKCVIVRLDDAIDKLTIVECWRAFNGTVIFNTDEFAVIVNMGGGHSSTCHIVLQQPDSNAIVKLNVAYKNKADGAKFEDAVADALYLSEKGNEEVREYIRKINPFKV
jgi:hypothetical protein